MGEVKMNCSQVSRVSPLRVFPLSGAVLNPELSRRPRAPAPPPPPSLSQRAVLIGRDWQWAHADPLVIGHSGCGLKTETTADWLFLDHRGSQQIWSGVCSGLGGVFPYNIITPNN